jgi:carboxymethylenebutenolidase
MAAPALRTEDLTFIRDGDRLKTYGAWPLREERLPALLIIPDVHGLSDHYRDITQRFAREGFFSIALDLYSREGAPKLGDMTSVQEWIRNLDDRRVLDDIAAAVRFLRSRVEVRKISIGVVGFCLGGQYALMSACGPADVNACVSFYGMLRYTEYNERKPKSPLDLAPQLSCPYLGLFGADDPLISRADVRELEALLRETGKRAQVKTYAGAGHAFFNDRRPDMYRPEAAADAWMKTIAFFRETLALG